MAKRKKYNPERKAWRGRAYKRGGERIGELREDTYDDIDYPSDAKIFAIMQVLTVNNDIVKLYQSRGVERNEVMQIMSMAMGRKPEPK